MVTTRSQRTTSAPASPKPNALRTSSTMKRRRRHDHSSSFRPAADKGTVTTVVKNKYPPISTPISNPFPSNCKPHLSASSKSESATRCTPYSSKQSSGTRPAASKPAQFFFSLLPLHPTPADLASATLSNLSALLQPIGLHNIRAARLIAFARTWVAAPPRRENRDRKLDYPRNGDGADVGPSEVLGEDDERVGWELAHLPAMGPYALDSFRIFGRDMLRGLDGVDGVEEEWRRVVPLDKDLRAYLKWRWREDGWEWDPLTGRFDRAETGADGDNAV